MKILAFEYRLPGVTAENFSEYANAETLRIWELHQQGIIRELHFRADRNEVVLELECENVESARQALKTLPSGKEGLIYFELIPLRKYTGFERLFQLEKVKNHDQNS
ncbi:MAG: superoxide dismutase [Chloroflexi bacterium]|nr:superoxide dismutase [Chloroflexota bacterium]